MTRRETTGLNDLEKALMEQIGALQPAPFAPGDAVGGWTESLDRTEKDNSKWIGYMIDALKTAKTFEIHCWNEESEWIDLALQYGQLKEADWRHGKIVTGAVTPEFTDMLLMQPKPTDTEIYNKMTPFFTIALDNGFWSEHYGTELNQA